MLGALTSWDPLEEAGETDKELLSAAKKREIKNILKSYVSNYDPFSELLQNAMDAVERRFQAGDVFSPKISVRVDLQENSLEVVDNGCGFEAEEFRTFLAPSISFKAGSKTRGNKGVGVTYVAYGFNELTIRTKNPSFSYQGSIRRGREWLEDTAGTVPRPKVDATTAESPAFKAIDHGTSFKIRFAGQYIRPSNLAWHQAQTAEQWLYLLLVKTPLGYIDLADPDSCPIRFDLTVVATDGSATELLDQQPKYKFPYIEIAASQNLSEIRKIQQKAIDAGKDVSQATHKYKNSNGVYEFYDKDRLLAMPGLSDEEKAEIEAYGMSAYCYFAYSTEIWDYVNDKKAKLRKGLRILRGGLQLANNGMPQGELITIPLTRSIGHQKPGACDRPF